AASPAMAQQGVQAARVADAGIEETKIVWAKPDGVELAATIYRPKSSTPLPMLVDVHGGAWSSGSHGSDRLYCVELAKSGLLVLSIDFRQAPQAKHPASSADIAAAVRFARMHAKAIS